MYSLHPQLAADTELVGRLPLSDVLLMNNAELPWIILVPRIEGAVEWHSLRADHRAQLHHESILIGQTLMERFNGDKLNVGSIGNMVPQLHVHHVIRYKSDSVWPKPVWGNIADQPYSPEVLEKMLAHLRKVLNKSGQTFRVG